MKKILLLFLSVSLILSCSTGSKFYKEYYTDENVVYLNIGESTENGMDTIRYQSTFQIVQGKRTDVKLDTEENRKVLEEALFEKGYILTDDIQSSSVILSVLDTSADGSTKVTLKLYRFPTEELLVECYGVYGMGEKTQKRMNKALKKALESLPSIKEY